MFLPYDAYVEVKLHCIGYTRSKLEKQNKDENILK